ncbi:MAG: cytochrome C, partial [Gammaproteobacteria bacterium]|nr:cytochrome C [Gammaproteobacteria bacterium]
PNANDNIAATQIQGHAGTISECTVCHETDALPANTQAGPHGMHLVNDRRFWREAHEEAAKRENGRPNGGTCSTCHGADHRGTVLSRTPVDRSWNVEGRTRTVAAGEPVGCGVCHDLDESFER